MLAPLLAALALATATPAHAPPPGPANSPSAIADGFFATLQAGEASKAYSQVLGRLATSKPAEMQNLVGQNEMALKMFGKISGWELARERVISPSFVERVYVLRTENAPLFYRMHFYRADTTWVLVSIFFNDTYDKLPGVADR
ncbi:MAG: hypothetical protein JWQ29_3383 [Phenylobacterium sp.]|nr:hypothetical protein [Phenylobacterium sp.]